jgi:hypothetical protein
VAEEGERRMIVGLKEKNSELPDLAVDQPYFVIGIKVDDYRILNDHDKPYVYPPDLFEIVDSRELSIWIIEYGDEGERYSYPAELNEAGFFEDYFDGKDDALSTFWHVVNKRLSEAA